MRLGTVQETLLLPLYGRARQTRSRRWGVIHDPKAVEMVETLDYDFERFRDGGSAVGATARTVMCDAWVRAFLRRNPTGTIVEIGAGLNTRFERIDNGTAHWVDIDLPDSMALRREFFSEGPRRRMVEGSVLDDAWFDTVRAFPGPYLFVIEGVLMYLDRVEVERALRRMAEAFPGARFIFDLCGSRMLEFQDRRGPLRHVDARLAWACEAPGEFERCGLRLLDSRSMRDLPRMVRIPLPLHITMTVAGPLLARGPSLHTFNLYEAPEPSGA
ncbi:class I SAM-dependent methyltransferase [Nocardiopsis gilva YIM 90087]|uniref:Class I SAM-dependent methyltransferase n=1 Tax=Nocardiopsis gilva YIM 90087 TaxID=1235441 RepID=A0A223S531_9ACTN|nr:class I SAM-dependent methyltransferase [Nocardiopsis gilva YIM 90087]